jgi:hypothetical protein
MDKIDLMFASFENALKSISENELNEIINRIDGLYSSKQQTVSEYFNSFEEHFEDLYQLDMNEAYSSLDFGTYSVVFKNIEEKYSNTRNAKNNFNLDSHQTPDYSPNSDLRQAA